jgi:uncharacterized protein (UPF0276 family)
VTTRPLLGVALPPDERFRQHNRALLEERAELFEITPETMWRAGCEPGPEHERLLAFTSRAGRPVVAHGVLGSIGAAVPPARRDVWLAALARDVEAFGCRWVSEHLGFADVDGLHVGWPLPLPPTGEAIDAVAASLRQLRDRVHATVCFENNADLFCLGDPLAQPVLFAQLCAAADAELLLDLHNAFAFCRNVGVPLDAWLDALPWARVRELHLSGGSDSDAALLANGRSLRLDSHDGAVPDEVWRVLPRALERAVNLQAVVLEWFPDAMDAAAARVLAADFDRARSVLC